MTALSAGGPAVVAVRSPGVLADRVLGRVTMYRVVALALGGIAAAALVLGLVGVLPYRPEGLLASLAVAVVVGVGTNALFARLRGLSAHADSGLITGLLGFFLFLPLPTLPALGALAGAVAAANLSKYLLVVRGRHVANPIAVGAVVVLLTGLSGATWWVATPVLLPFVLLGGLAVVRRAGAWDLALPVLVVAVIGTTATLVAGGTAPAAALWTAVASFPALFLAAFMVTEPLTAPPRRWQRLLVSALVGAIALVPLRVGYVAMAPEIALVLANAVAFAFGQRRRVRLVLAGREAHAGGLEELRFTAEAPLRIRPGQYVELGVPHARVDGRGARRAFSPANAPGSTDVRILTRRAEPSSSFKRALLALEPGAAVAGAAVAGDFLPPRDPGEKVLWIAGGIGVTPFTAMADAEPHRDAHLVWVVRDGDDLGWAADALGDVPVHVVGPEALREALPSGWRWAGERLARETLLAAAPDLADRAVYAAGSPVVVAAARRAAKAAGAGRVRTDRFVGY